MRTLLLVVIALAACDSHKRDARVVPRAAPVTTAHVEARPALPTDAARELVIARNNALHADPEVPPPGNEPVPLPPRTRALVDAIDQYVAVASPDDPELPGMKFIAAAALARWRDPDAFHRLAAQVRDYPHDDTAEYATNILLDLLNRGGSYDEMRTWVDTLRADPAFLAGRDDLRTTLDRLDSALASNGVR